MQNNSRKANFEINPLFLNRWSPRAFTGENIPDSVLMSAFEAARWAPSGGNSQPWRFIYCKKDSASWSTFCEFLFEGNRQWAKNASALIVLLAKKDFVFNGQPTQSSSYSFDAGAAWQSFALQAIELGWHTHAMAGFDKQKTREHFKISENFSVEIMIAIGKPGEKSVLPEPLQAREFASDRAPLNTLISEGTFSNK